MLKRIFDLLIAGTGLLILSPLLVLMALWIKFDSAGPVFYRQERVGRFGKLFRIHKFRSMTHAQDSGAPQLTVAGDARITSAGRFLRASKLDELAQLVDVVQGNMSLVGPRPEVPRYVAHYPQDVRNKVLSVRPGITDFASIEYRDESRLLAQATDPEREYLEVVMPAKLRYAQRYVDEASLLTDLKLIFRTLKALALH